MLKGSPRVSTALEKGKVRLSKVSKKGNLWMARASYKEPVSESYTPAKGSSDKFGIGKRES
jgi:hypothetical protein